MVIRIELSLKATLETPAIDTVAQTSRALRELGDVRRAAFNVPRRDLVRSRRARRNPVLIVSHERTSSLVQMRQSGLSQPASTARRDGSTKSTASIVPPSW